MSKPKKIQYNGSSKVVTYVCSCVNWLIDNLSNVTANPQATATDTLTKVEIDGTVYNVSGSVQNISADHVSYDNTQSGLTADDVQEAIDELADEKVDKVSGKGLSTNDFTDTLKDKLDGIESGAEVNTVDSVNGKTGTVVLDKSDVGLGNVNNTSDVDKPISTATQTALNLKANTADLGTASEKNFTTSVTQGSNDLVTSGAVYNEFANLPKPEIFKGTLGTNGTITTLPTASSSNEGWEYKVITAGTYAGQTAKVGDCFISDGTQWVYIPSGDETDTDTWRGVNVNGSQLLGNGILSGNVNFKSGTNAQVSGSGNDITVDVSTTFTDASTRTNIASGDTFATILGKIKKWFSDLKTVAFSGSYNDLSNKPTIPTVNNATLNIKKNGTSQGTFTANASSDVNIDISVPTKTSDLTNDSGYVTSSGTVANATDATYSKMLKATRTNVGVYRSSDTHILQLGYFTRSTDWNNITILVTSEFWGNQHGSSDIINIRQDSNGSNTQTLSRIVIDTSVTRVFYYQVIDNKVYLYVYVVGGNQYGEWNVSIIQQCGSTTWVDDIVPNHSDITSTATVVPFGGYVNIAVKDSENNQINTTYVKKTGGTMSGDLSMAGKDILLKTNSSSSNDSGDIVWYYGNGQEKARLWTENTYTSALGLNYRVYKPDGTLLGNTELATTLNALMRYNWWSSGTTHNANDVIAGIVFAYSNQSNTATTGTLVDFSCVDNKNYRFQLQCAYSSNSLYFRRQNGDVNGGTWAGWREIVHDGNITYWCSLNSVPLATGGGLGTVGGSGTHSAVKIATLIYSAQYTDGPITFEVSQRDYKFSTLQLSISGSVGAKKVLYFTTDNENPYYIYNVDGTTFELYAHINYVWGAISLHRISGYRYNNGNTVTVNMEKVSSIPSGAVQCTYGGNVNYATTARSATSDSDGNTINTTYLKLTGGTLTGQLTLNSSGSVSSGNTKAVTGGTVYSYLQSFYITAGKRVNTTLGTKATAEGNDNTSSGDYSHAEGSSCRATNENAHAEGYNTLASGESSHAEGGFCQATATRSHAEGDYTYASGLYSHTEGSGCEAMGTCSHAEGKNTIAKGSEQHVSGKNNIRDDSNTYAVIVGNGSSTSSRSNAMTLDWSGNLKATSYSNFSSRKYKENIQDMSDEEALKLLQLNPVSYDYKSDYLPNNQFGLIAEDVEQIMTYPIVYENNEADSIDYSKFVPAIIKLCQIQQREIEELKERINGLD